MIRKSYITLFVLMGVLNGFSQVENANLQFELTGTVKSEENRDPIFGVHVSTDKGQYAMTNGLGEFRIKASVGDILLVESPDFETVRYRIKSNERIDILVAEHDSQDVSKKESKRSMAISSLDIHQRFLDSANQYKRLDLQKSIDFITKSIAPLDSRGNKRELSQSLTTLGEIYSYHKQYDLAIGNFKDALEANRSNRTSVLLGRTYVQNGQFSEAKSILSPLTKSRNMVPYQRIQLYEALGDSEKGLKNWKEAIDFYKESLRIAEKNQVSPKIIDLNSKIADAYASEDKNIEAEGFYNNSLSLSQEVAPERSIQEKEKVADFYNQKNRFQDEIQLRKKSLSELQQLGSSQGPKTAKGLLSGDTITSQQINYKIANAYISQNKLDEAIPYLERSIVEADAEDDLVIQKDATRRLSEVYRNKGDFSKALESYQTYVNVVDSLYVRKEEEISKAARLNREIATKQNRISSLEQDRELSQSKYSLALTEQKLFEETSKRQVWIIYSLIFGLLLMALTAFLYYRSNKQQKLANNLLALKSLRTQMNPHFIFNALNSVNNYIAKSDERSANRFLSDFSVLMRSVLENSEEDFIPLSKELELIKLYVKLEHSRFTDKFDFEIHVDENIDIEAFQIPPMLLQPYIENAIWHGLRYKDEKGFLKIRVEPLTQDLLEIHIEDDGIGRKKSAELKTSNQKRQKSKGMGNIKKRIQILNEMYKNKVEISIRDLKEDQTGTKVSLKLMK